MATPFDKKEAMTFAIAEEVEPGPATGTAEDQYDMTRIGKKQELLVKNYRFPPGIS